MRLEILQKRISEKKVSQSVLFRDLRVKDLKIEMGRESIFTLEKRMDFNTAFADFLSDMDKSSVEISIGNRIIVSKYLDHCIRYWPYRCGTTGIAEYLKAINIDINNPNPEKDALLMMELFINLLHWAPKQYNKDTSNDAFGLTFQKNNVEKESERLIENAKYILEQCCNMRIREVIHGDIFPQYRIIKRSAQVDAAVEAVPELSDVLLGYLDIRNADSREYKEAALTAVYGYVEPKRSIYRGMACSSVSEEFFTCMNSFGIRHKGKSQVKIHYTKRNAIYDKLFKMALFVLQTPDVNEFKDEMKELREKKS